MDDRRITKHLILSLPAETVLGTYIRDWDSPKQEGKAPAPRWLGIVPEGIHERLRLWESAKTYRVTGRIAWVDRDPGNELLEAIKSTYLLPYMTPYELKEEECVSIDLIECNWCDESVAF